MDKASVANVMVATFGASAWFYGDNGNHLVLCCAVVSLIFAALSAFREDLSTKEKIKSKLASSFVGFFFGTIIGMFCSHIPGVIEKVGNYPIIIGATASAITSILICFWSDFKIVANDIAKFVIKFKRKI
jgi:hypothetical protein